MTSKMHAKSDTLSKSILTDFQYLFAWNECFKKIETIDYTSNV